MFVFGVCSFITLWFWVIGLFWSSAWLGCLVFGVVFDLRGVFNVFWHDLRCFEGCLLVGRVAVLRLRWAFTFELCFSVGLSICDDLFVAVCFGFALVWRFAVRIWYLINLVSALD